MQEHDALPMGSHTRLPDGSESFGPGAGQGGIQILYLETEVMNALPAFFQESSDRAIGGEGFQKLEVHLPDGEEGGLDLFGFDGFPVRTAEPQTPLVGSDRGF